MVGWKLRAAYGQDHCRAILIADVAVIGRVSTRPKMAGRLQIEKSGALLRRILRPLVAVMRSNCF
jgi:hypothetical protein